MPAPSSHAPAATHTARGRLVWVDVARGLALVAMMVAHTAPAGGPGGVLHLSEHLTAPLFAALVGVGARLEAEWLGRGRAVPRALVRAAALCGATWLTGLFGAAVVNVLAHLAVLTVLMALLAALPLAAHLVLAVLAGGGGLLLAATSTDTVRSKAYSGKPARQLRTAWTEAWESPESPGTLPMPLQFILNSYAMRRAQRAGANELLGMPVGQIVGRMNNVRTAKQVIYEMVEEYVDVTERLHRSTAT